NVRPRAYIALADIPSAIRKLTRRLDDLRDLEPGFDSDHLGTARVIANKVNTTIEEVFGDDTQEAKRFHVDRLSFWSSFEDERIDASNRGRNRAIACYRIASREVGRCRRGCKRKNAARLPRARTPFGNCSRREQALPRWSPLQRR